MSWPRGPPRSCAGPPSSSRGTRASSSPTWRSCSWLRSRCRCSGGRAWGGRGRWLAFLLAASAAFCAKGLIGPALVWAAVGTFLILKRRWRLLAGLGGAYLPLVVLVVLPWVVALRGFGGDAALKFVFWDNQIGRFFAFSDASLPHDPFFINKEPWHYYLTTLPVYLAPWTPLLVPALVAWVRR